MTDSRNPSAYIAVLISATLWGFIGFFSRNLYDEGFSPIQVAFMRMLIGTLVLTFFLLLTDRACLRLKRRDLWIFVFFGVFKILSDLFLFQAQVVIHLSLSTVLQLTSPYWVLVFSVFLFGERTTLKKVFAICVAFVGCILVTGVLSKDVNFDLVGVLFAIMSGISYAVYTVGTKVLMNRGYSSNTVLFFVFAISTIICIPFADTVDIPGKVVDLEVVWNLLAMGVLMTLVPYYLQIYAVRYISPVSVNVIGLVEVVAAVIVGWIFYNESLGWLNFIGMVLIPLSIVIMNVQLRRTAEARANE
ncbi:MAG: DMT family transporter [archaeon]|nr:DMT family transporter [archaeon]